MVTFICNKIGRDKGLEGFKSEGIIPTYKKLTGKELKDALKVKLAEETAEVTHATDQELVSELADVLEVIDGLCTAYGISSQELMKVKEQKKIERGGFVTGLFIESIQMEDDNPKVKHFRKSPDKYPEK